MIERVLNKLHTMWLKSTYPFAQLGSGTSIHFRSEIAKAQASDIHIGKSVFIGRDAWLNVEAPGLGSSGPKIIVGAGCKIGKRSVLSARSSVVLEDDVLLAPGVLIMDHNHEYRNPNLPIHHQGVTEGGRILIGRNSWLGYGSVICTGRGTLTLGRNSVVGANSVVTKSFPPFSVVAGNPAKLIKIYDPERREWVKIPAEDSGLIGNA